MSRMRRNWLIAEMAGLYIVAPLGVFILVIEGRLPLLVVFLPLFALFFFWLNSDANFSWRRVFVNWCPRGELGRILLLFAVLGTGLSAFAYFWQPEAFLSFPQRLPTTWLLVMVLYPLISVTTQEVIYRVFFQHRYGAIFAGNRTLLIVVNAALFAFSHIIFQSWVSVGISFVGGLIFAYRYFTSRSFWGVFIEHSLYGNLIFTSGLGPYFFTGVALPV